MAAGTMDRVAEGKAQEGPRTSLPRKSALRVMPVTPRKAPSAVWQRLPANETVWLLRCQNTSYRVDAHSQSGCEGRESGRLSRRASLDFFVDVHRVGKNERGGV
jgi:hypothetical protein